MNPTTTAPTNESRSAAETLIAADRNAAAGGIAAWLAPWLGWRIRLLLAAALLGIAGVVGLVNVSMSVEHINATWRADSLNRLVLVSSTDPALRPLVGKTLQSIIAGNITLSDIDALVLRRSPRWIVSDALRQRQQHLHRQLAAALEHDRVRLLFDDGSGADVRPVPHGVSGLPLLFWVLTVFGLALYLVAWGVLIANPSGRTVAYAVMAWCQAGNLMFIAIESGLEFGVPAAFGGWDMGLRMGFDLVTAAAMVTAACLHPRPLPGSIWLALFAWFVAFTLAGTFVADELHDAWWWTQGAVIGLGAMAIGLMSWSHQIEPHPFAILLRRFGIVTIATWALLTVTVAATAGLPAFPHNIADIGSMGWYVFLGSLLILVPFLAKSHNFMREFTLLAAISTVATSLDLLFVAVFSLDPFVALTLALFVSIGVYMAARRWVLNQMLGSSMLSNERLFEQLYRIAREVETHPQRAPALVMHLISDLFEPLEVNLVEQQVTRSRVAADGSTMLAPVPVFGDETAQRSAVLVRFAHRGRRLFTAQDARLTDRIAEQLRRVVNFDRAVEQGRSEERARLAQDLHDDIGARLLTMMYKAPSPEMEDYLRHTLQDLKTLTRGLAASTHRLSHAGAEWKSDLSHRLTAAHVHLDWSFDFDEDITLTVVHWSALTRILRELVSNAITHSQAQRLDIDFRLAVGVIELEVTDNGLGRNPISWAPGLGLGGVRKRVKQLGGEVEWREAVPRGITCRVTIRDLNARL